MFEGNSNIDKLCNIDNSDKPASGQQLNSSGNRMSGDNNARSNQLTDNKRTKKSTSQSVENRGKKSAKRQSTTATTTIPTTATEVAVIDVDQTNINKSNNNSNPTIDSRACTKPEKKLWFRGVRSSKFRHVYGAPSRKENSYTDISVVRSGNDGNLCAVNPMFLAIVVDYAFVVIPITQTGRIDFQCSKVLGHSGQILDLKWNPFNDNIIASAADDCSIKIWRIPEGGLTSNLDESELELLAHRRKVLHIEWHPTASNILFSAGFDHSVIVWDISDSKAEILKTIDCHVDMIYSLAVNRDGSYIATTSKDKKLRVIEPRTGIVISEGICHMGTKCSKVTFLDNGKVLTTGFTRHSDRQYAIWDQHDLRNPLTQEIMDSSSGVVIPYFDYDTRILYLAGKGDGNIRYYEIVDEAPYIHYLNQFLSGHPQKALGFMPKRGLNTNNCEIFRFYKLHAAGNICEPISMIVPRRSTMFQHDLYPDTSANIPAITSKEWFQGRNVQPIMMSMVNGEAKVLNDQNVKYSKKEPQQQQQQQQQQQASAGERQKIATEPSYTIHFKNNLNGFNKHKENDNKIIKSCDNNNSKKFAFLSQQTIPDYRPQQLIEKSQKTSTNQSTKFHQLQAIFGHQGANIKDIANMQNALEKNGTPNGSLENIHLTYSENDLRKAFNRQVEEIKNLKNQLTNSEKRIQELEIEVKRLQLLSS